MGSCRGGPPVGTGAELGPVRGSTVETPGQVPSACHPACSLPGFWVQGVPHIAKETASFSKAPHLERRRPVQLEVGKAGLAPKEDCQFLSFSVSTLGRMLPHAHLSPPCCDFGFRQMSHRCLSPPRLSSLILLFQCIYHNCSL